MAEELAEILLSWSWAGATLQWRVGGVEVAPHGTADVDGGVACDAPVSPSWATGYRWGASKIPALEGAKAGVHRAEGPWRGLLFPPSHRELPRQVPPKMRGEVRGSPQQLLAAFDPTKPVFEGPNRLY